MKICRACERQLFDSERRCKFCGSTQHITQDDNGIPKVAAALSFVGWLVLIGAAVTIIVTFNQRGVTEEGAWITAFMAFSSGLGFGLLLLAAATIVGQLNYMAEALLFSVGELRRIGPPSAPPQPHVATAPVVEDRDD